MDEADRLYAECQAAIKATYAACDAARDASNAVLAHSALWLTVHPITHRRLRRELLYRRAMMQTARDAMLGAQRRYQAHVQTLLRFSPSP